MKTEIEIKLDKIADIWNYYILKHKFCSNKIKFDDDAKTNYFGDILSYFHDTFSVILNFENTSNNSFTDLFSRNISLLQAIYVHQDFIEELLILFKCKITKGQLKKDDNYSINRDIRNELVGHPIRRLNGKLVSSTSFGYNSDNKKIVYLCYHIDNQFEFEIKEYLISDIIQNHIDFLNKYFDIILVKLKKILKDFEIELIKIENLISTNNFEPLIDYVDKIYNSILKENYLFEKHNLLIVYYKRFEHKRYENHINYFISELSDYLKDARKFISEIFEPIELKKINIVQNTCLPIMFYSKNDETNFIEKLNNEKVSYTYELSKLATREHSFQVDFALSCLKQKCSNNQIVLDELDYLELNQNNEIEYHCSLNLIRHYLNED